jgi:hypothetical protein
MHKLALFSSLLALACNPQKTEKSTAPTSVSVSTPAQPQKPGSSLRFSVTGVGALHSSVLWTPERVAATLPGYTLKIDKKGSFEEWFLMQGETMIADLLNHEGSLLGASVYIGEVEGARVNPGGSFDALLGPSLTCENLERPDGAVLCADDVPPPPVSVGARTLAYWMKPPATTKIPQGRFAPELLKGAKIEWISLTFDRRAFPAPPTDATAKASWSQDLVVWENLDDIWVGMTSSDINEVTGSDSLVEGKEELAGLSCKTLENKVQGYRLWVAESGPSAGKVVALEAWIAEDPEQQTIELSTWRDAKFGMELAEVEKIYADLGAARVGNEVRIGAGENWVSLRAKDGAKLDKIFIGRANPEWLAKR